MFTDADIEQAELEAEGNRIAALRARGICTHGWTQGYTAAYRPDLAPAKVECHDCGRIFGTQAELDAERAERLA